MYLSDIHTHSIASGHGTTCTISDMAKAASKKGLKLLGISDHGPGIPADVKAKLFEPFFSTKAEGMGIGLNICRSIAEMHQGRLRVEDNPGGGTIFILTLPAYTEGAAFQA